MNIRFSALHDLDHTHVPGFWCSCNWIKKIVMGPIDLWYSGKIMISVGHRIENRYILISITLM